MVPGGRALTTRRLPVAYHLVTCWLPCGQELVSRRSDAGYIIPVTSYRMQDASYIEEAIGGVEEN